MPGGSSSGSPSTRHLHRQAGRPQPADQLVEPSERRLRHERRALLALAQQPSRLRISSSAWVAVPLDRVERLACRPDRRSSMRRPPRAWSTITLIACATPSCSSRAMRVRSGGRGALPPARARARSGGARAARRGTGRRRTSRRTRGRRRRVLPGLDGRERDTDDDQGDAYDVRAAARVPPGRVDRRRRARTGTRRSRRAPGRRDSRTR